MVFVNKKTYVAGLERAGTGIGTTSEQSMKPAVSCAITASLAMTALKADDIFSCSLTNPCHVHALQIKMNQMLCRRYGGVTYVLGSRAKAKSD